MRIDKTPYYFYSEICKKLGLRVNLDQQFPGFRDKDTINNKSTKSTYTRKEDDEENEDYRNFLDMNVKKGVYVPPAFRKEKDDEKFNKLNKLNHSESKQSNEVNKQNTSSKNNFSIDEAFPELGKVNIATNNVKLTTNSIWAKKPNIIPDEVKEVKKETEEAEEITVDTQTNEEPKVNKEEYVFSTSWEIEE